MSTHPVENPRAEARTTVPAEKRLGLTFRRHFTKAGRHPYDELSWEPRIALRDGLSRTIEFFREVTAAR